MRKPLETLAVFLLHLFCLQHLVGEDGFEPSKHTQQIYSLSPLATRELPHIHFTAWSR